jgi:hypothetical protein
MKLGKTNVSLLLLVLLIATPAIVFVVKVSGQTGSQLVISEFRLRGPNGANDEFIEIYNNLDNGVIVLSPDSSGYSIAASDGVVRCVIPNETLIPARGHFLCANSVGYSLAAHPAGNGTTATPDATFTTNIPDNAGIALFTTSNPANFNLSTRFDAVGSTSEPNALYKEGAGYPALIPFSIDYSFYRSYCPVSASGAGPVCTPGATAIPQDTNDNARDFVFVDTNGTSAGAGQRLGAPGPENRSGPTHLQDFPGIAHAPFDPAQADNVAPNVARDFTSDPPNNSTFGTLSIRRTWTNNTGFGVDVSRLRFRVAEVETFPAPAGTADLRPRTSTAIVVTRTDGSTATVQGTTLEQPPQQPNGGGFNSSLSAANISLATPLPPGGSISVQFLFGIQQTGCYKVGIFAESSQSFPTGGGSDLFVVAGNTDGPNENCPAAPTPTPTPTPSATPTPTPTPTPRPPPTPCEGNDTDGDGLANRCDPDDDNDGVPDGQDNCRLVANPNQQDTDGDGLGDRCDRDNDGDGVPDDHDNCPLTPNTNQRDSDNDGVGDRCDSEPSAALDWLRHPVIRPRVSLLPGIG